MFLYYKYVQLWGEQGQLFCYMCFVQSLRSVFSIIVIKILLHTDIIKRGASVQSLQRVVFFPCYLQIILVNFDNL